MEKVKRNLLKIVLLLFVLGALYIAHLLYFPKVHYSSGEEVSRETLNNYRAREGMVKVTGDFRRFMLSSEISKSDKEYLKAMRNPFIKYDSYKNILEQDGVIETFEIKKKQRWVIIKAGMIAAALIWAFVLFLVPYAIKRNKEIEEEETREEEQRQFQEKQKRKREAYEAERRADDERRRLEEFAREREARLRKENEEREKREKDEFQCYYESIKEEVKGSNDEEILIQLLRKYLKKQLMDGTSKAIQSKIEEIENERTKNKISAMAREDLNRERQAKEEERAEKKEGAGKEETGDDDMYLA